VQAAVLKAIALVWTGAWRGTLFLHRRQDLCQGMDMDDTNTTPTDPQQTDLSWKWLAILGPQTPDFEQTWRGWLGAAQRAEQEADLRFWARREGHQAAA
jgi:hypothetical protein